MELRDLTDERLDALRRNVLIEQERRANLAVIPEQIAALAQTFRDGGGDEQALTDALTPEQVAALHTGPPHLSAPALPGPFSCPMKGGLHACIEGEC